MWCVRNEIDVMVSSAIDKRMNKGVSTIVGVQLVLRRWSCSGDWLASPLENIHVDAYVCRIVHCHRNFHQVPRVSELGKTANPTAGTCGAQVKIKVALVYIYIYLGICISFIIIPRTGYETMSQRSRNDTLIR